MRPLLSVVCSVLALLSPCSQAISNPKAQQYGESIVKSYEIPAEKIVKFAQFTPSAADPHESTIVNTLLADSEDWKGEIFTAKNSSTPYSFVVTILGTAKEDGAVSSLWHAGWELEDGVAKLFPLAGLSKSPVKAGELVVLTQALPPNRFKGRVDVMPVLSLVRASNFRISKVQVDIWSGARPMRISQILLSFQTLWIGLVMLILVWWFRRR